MTELQEMLVKMLKLFKVSLRSTEAMIIALKTQKQQMEMMDYLIENQQATEQQIIQQFKKIIKN